MKNYMLGVIIGGSVAFAGLVIRDASLAFLIIAFISVFGAFLNDRINNE